MFGRIGIMALVAMALNALVAVDAEAHWTIVSGQLVYHSLDCQSVIKDWDPALAGQGVCRVTATAREIRCYNPQGKYNAMGTAFNPYPFKAVAGAVQQDTVTKNGKSQQAAGHLKLEVVSNDELLSLGLTWSDVGCPNSKWNVRAVLRSADLTVDVYQCKSYDPTTGAPTCLPLDPAIPDLSAYEYDYTATFRCTLDSSYSFDNYPPPPGTSMNCSKVSSQHVL
jgi:hypothetical protein